MDESKTLTIEMLQELSRPFDPAVVQFKPGAVTRDKTRALGLAYADSRAYYDRLDQVAGVDWADDYEVSQDGQRVVCRLTIGGVTRCDVGECDLGDKNTVTSAAAQAFKRSAAKFGLGRYLYNLPQSWVDYDSQSRRFTNQALKNLRRQLNHSTNPGPYFEAEDVLVKNNAGKMVRLGDLEPEALEYIKTSDRYDREQRESASVILAARNGDE